MLRRAVKNGFIAKYLFMDKWYFGKGLIKEVRCIKNSAIHVITLLKKKDTRFTVDGKPISATLLMVNCSATSGKPCWNLHS